MRINKSTISIYGILIASFAKLDNVTKMSNRNIFKLLFYNIFIYFERQIFDD